MKTQTIKCNFKNSQGFTLDARLDLPKKFDPVSNNILKAFIIFSHCFTCSKETITTYRLGRLLAEQGYGVLRFDFMGLGNSEGDFATTTFASTQDDLNSAIGFLSEHYQAPKFLMGHSFGGTTALAIAQQHSNIKGVVTIASPSQPDHVLHHFGHALTMLEQGFSSSFEVAGQFFDIEPAFVTDVRAIDMRIALAELDKPVLIFTIENDVLVSERNATEIALWTKGTTELVELKNTDHMLINKNTSTNVATKIINWMEKNNNNNGEFA